MRKIAGRKRQKKRTLRGCAFSLYKSKTYFKAALPVVKLSETT